MVRQQLVILTLLLGTAIAARMSLQSKASVPPFWTGASLNGVTIGMAQHEVIKRLGHPECPPFSYTSRSGADTSYWMWHPWWDAAFDSTNQVVAVGGWPLRVGDHCIASENTSTSDINLLFGKPAVVGRSHDANADTEWIYKGQDDLELLFEFDRSKVCYIFLGHSRFFRPEKQFRLQSDWL